MGTGNNTELGKPERAWLLQHNFDDLRTDLN
jgi:hypothetical protein